MTPSPSSFAEPMAEERPARWRHQSWLVWLTLALGLGVTAQLAWRASQERAEQAELAFQALTNDSTLRLENRLQAYIAILRAGSGLFASRGEVSRQEWNLFASPQNLRRHFPGIQGLGFAEYIPAARLAEHETRIQQDGFPGYRVRPPGLRDEYTAITMLEPFDLRNQRAFGFDMFSETTRRLAMSRARDTGEPAMSGKVTLVQETRKDVQAGFLIYVPVYRQDLPLRNLVERRAALQGYVYSPFRMGDLMQGVLGNQSAQVYLEVHDGDDVGPSSLMYQSSAPPLDKVRVLQHTLNIAGHHWTLRICSQPAFEARYPLHGVWVVLGAGLMLSVTLAALVASLLGRRQRALLLADRMSASFRKQSSYIEAVLAAAGDGILTVGEDGAILTANRAAELMLGLMPGGAKGKAVGGLLPDLAGDTIRRIAHGDEAVRRAVSQSSRHAEAHGEHGLRFPVSLAVSVLEHADTRQVIVVVHDQSALQASQLALVHSEARLQLALEAAADGLWDCDLLTGTSYFSPRWRDIVGVREGAVAGGLDGWKHGAVMEDRPLLDRALAECLASHENSFMVEYRIERSDGELLWVMTHGLVQQDEAGQPTRLTGILSDITTRKQAEQLKAEFVATVSHELRTPLTSIRGSLGLLSAGAMGELQPQVQQMIEMAARNTERLLLLINDLLDMDKLENGQLQCVCQPQPLLPLLQQSLTANAGYAAQYRVNYHLRGDVPDVWVNVDGIRYCQVLANLLSNAAKFSRADDEVVIRVQIEGDWVRVSVIDHGPGIPMHFQSRIFGRFSQADASDSRRKGGTGLGLNISKALMGLMKGDLGFHSVPGKGATFFTLLPVCAASDTETEAR
ncbi:CHASE domain-containing protein [Leeia sp.]|uniref:CHASE domain-containing protein n=1 Tax=Leeia sp. TaxID=2884678 RepID=UPI0035ADB0BA